MKYFLLLIFLPLFSFGQVTDQALTGLWVKVKAQMKDGSRIVDHYGCGMDFLKYNFGNDGYVIYSSGVLFEGYKLPYKLKGDSLVAGGAIYNVIGLANDTLKLSLFAPFGVQDKQIPVYYFVKTMEHNVRTAATFNAILKDSVYEATRELFPQCKGDLNSWMSEINARYDKGSLKASFIVDKKGRVKDFTVLSLDSVSKGFAKIAGNGIGNLSWIPAKKNGVPVNSLVLVTIKTGRRPYPGLGEMNTMSVEYPFISPAPYGKLTEEEVEAVRQTTDEAIKQSNNRNYDKALELLDQCLQVDSINLNAYYLKAFIHTNLGKKKEACADWSVLAGLGQVEATQNLAKFCKN